MNKILDCKENNFYSTDDRETCKESHGATNCRKLINELCCTVLVYSVKCWSVQVDSQKSEFILPFVTCEKKSVYLIPEYIRSLPEEPHLA